MVSALLITFNQAEFVAKAIESILSQKTTFFFELIIADDNSTDTARDIGMAAKRKGITVEVGNTDAEGRLILCDALAEADSEDPEVIIDFATLTGAARVALGTDVPALFSNRDEWANAFLSSVSRAEAKLVYFSSSGMNLGFSSSVLRKASIS